MSGDNAPTQRFPALLERLRRALAMARDVETMFAEERRDATAEGRRLAETIEALRAVLDITGDDTEFRAQVQEALDTLEHEKEQNERSLQAVEPLATEASRRAAKFQAAADWLAELSIEAAKPNTMIDGVMRVMQVGLPGQTWTATELMNELRERGWLTSQAQEPLESVRWSANKLVRSGHLRRFGNRFVLDNPFGSAATQPDELDDVLPLDTEGDDGWVSVPEAVKRATGGDGL